MGNMFSKNKLLQSDLAGERSQFAAENKTASERTFVRFFSTKHGSLRITVGRWLPKETPIRSAPPAGRHLPHPDHKERFTMMGLLLLLLPLLTLAPTADRTISLVDNALPEHPDWDESFTPMVLIRGGRVKDSPGVKSHRIRGVKDLLGIPKRSKKAVNQIWKNRNETALFAYYGSLTCDIPCFDEQHPVHSPRLGSSAKKNFKLRAKRR
ncbi:hypothetical protein GBA52_015335 [Prunus armeniaca]|nr:hypothetical protein GBA52_015335 [Prunus armeniaca]